MGWKGSRPNRKTSGGAASSAFSLVGLVSFLLYSEVRFGDWALYFRYTGSAWGADAASGLSLNPLLIFSGFTWHENLAVRISNLIVITMPFVIASVAFVTLRFSDQAKHLYLAVIAAILMLFYLYSVPGNNSQFPNFNIMRHMLPLVALLILLVMTLPLSKLKQQTAGAIALGLLALVYLQLHFQVKMFHAFKFGYWVS